MNKGFKKKIVGALVVLSLSSVFSPLVHQSNVFAEGVEGTTGNYLTGYLDENGNVVFYTSVGEDRAVTAVTIAVFVSGAFVGYLTGSVIDGIVISATGHSGGEWVARAIKSVLGTKYKGSVYLSHDAFTCPDVVIDHSGLLCK